MSLFFDLIVNEWIVIFFVFLSYLRFSFFPFYTSFFFFLLSSHCRLHSVKVSYAPSSLAFSYFFFNANMDASHEKERNALLVHSLPCYFALQRCKWARVYGNMWTDYLACIICSYELLGRMEDIVNYLYGHTHIILVQCMVAYRYINMYAILEWKVRTYIIKTKIHNTHFWLST